MRRRDVMKLLGAGALMAWPGAARPQTYPTQPIKLIVPFGASGSLDVLARLLGDEVSRSLGQSIVIDNRPGAAGNLAAETVAKAEPDGHTLLVVSAAFAVNATLYRNLRFDPRKDFAPIAILGATQNVLVANTQFPAHTLADLLARAKKEPGKIDFASTGVGTSGHLTVELLKIKAGINLTHVPYRSISQQMTDLIAGAARNADDPGRAWPYRDRQAAPAGGLGRAALPGAARGADRRGDGRCGLRRHHLVCAAWPRRHAARRHRSAQQRVPLQHCRASSGREARQARDRADAHEPGGTFRLYRGRNREMGRRGEGGQYQGGLTVPASCPGRSEAESRDTGWSNLPCASALFLGRTSL
jgi:Tripartite tricarboxylate transporter family receptor